MKEYNELEHRCGECRHFVDGGDFNLCCDIKYGLCYKYTLACKDFVPDVRQRKDELNGEK